MHAIFVGIGSNIDRTHNIRDGVQALRQNYGDLLISSVYESIPFGFDGDNFFNLVVGFSSDKAVESVVTDLHQIENTSGRNEKLSKYAARTLDIDLLLFDDLIIEEKGLKLPRADLLKYSFVLCPMAEIAPDRLHPVEKKTYKKLWQNYEKPRNDLWKIDFSWDTAN